MDRTLLKALYIILMSAGLAFVFNFLFFGKSLGISVFLFATVLLGAVFLFGQYHKVSLKQVWWLIVPIGFFSLMPAIRANEFLLFLNVCASLGLLMLLAYQFNGMPAWVMRLRDYIAFVIITPLHMLGKAFLTISMVGQIHSNVKHRDIWIRVVKGVLMAIPILVLFGILFSQADLAFSQFVKQFVDVSVSERTVQYIVLLAFAFVAALGFLSYIFFPKPAQAAAAAPENKPEVATNKSIEVVVFLGLISALFLVFIIFQLTYLFGGEANIITAGFTYAEYARRGFWELLAVAFLSLVVLIAAEKHAGAEGKRDRMFLIPALILIAEVVIIIVSAFKRLSLYIDAYGMTQLRFYVVAFIILLLVLFILVALKFILSKHEQFFTFGALLSGIGFLMLVNIINPDVFIIRSNIEQYNRTGKVDVDYIDDLSVDAQSGKIELYNQLTGEDKAMLQVMLTSEMQDLQHANNDWRSANTSRWRGEQLLNNLKE